MRKCRAKFLFISCVCCLSFCLAFSSIALGTDGQNIENRKSDLCNHSNIDWPVVYCAQAGKTTIQSRSSTWYDNDDLWFDFDGDGKIDYYETVTATDTTMTTPNGNLVLVSNVTGELIQVYLDAFDSYSATSYPNAIMLDNSTAKYNCHSYAWYSQNIQTNSFWMNSPEAFYTNNGGYVEVSTPQVGDIICYFSDSNINLHSGIVSAVRTGTSNNVCGNADLVTVQSKWGLYGLYEHRGDQCPYVDQPNGPAEYVKYYRPVNHTHNITHISSNTGRLANHHELACYGCGIVVWEEHDFTNEYYSYTATTHEAECAICGDVESVPHTFSSFGTSISPNRHTKPCPCGYSIAEWHHFSSYNATMHTGACTDCGEVPSGHWHSTGSTPHTPDQHLTECAYCDLQRYESHVPYHITPVTDSDHDIECDECGFTEQGPHDWYDVEFENGDVASMCLICHYTYYVARRMTATDMGLLSPAVLKQLATLQKTGVDEFFVQIDSKVFICYKDGNYYRIEYTEPQNNITPVIPPALLE